MEATENDPIALEKPPTNSIAPEKQPTYTKGEKCIFYHLFITFALVLIVVIIYLTHILLVGHKGNEYFKISRRSEVPKKSSYQSIGMVYLNFSRPKIVCCSLLLKHSWSIVSAHCVTIRSNPELSNLLPKWTILYKSSDDEDLVTEIKRGIVHSYYDSDDFNNNIGLFEHKDPIDTNVFEIFNVTLQPLEILKENPDSHNNLNMKLVAWKDEYFRSIVLVKPMSEEMCSKVLSPVGIELRENELCVEMKQNKNVELDNGAVLMIKEHIIGFFSWGDRTGKGLPFVILNVYPYKNWLEYMLSIY